MEEVHYAPGRAAHVSWHRAGLRPTGCEAHARPGPGPAHASYLHAACTCMYHGLLRHIVVDDNDITYISRYCPTSFIKQIFICVYETKSAAAQCSKTYF